MTRLTRSIQLALVSSALILAGCKSRTRKEAEPVAYEDRRPVEQALFAASTVGLLAAPAGQGPWLAAMSLFPQPGQVPGPSQLVGPGDGTARRTGRTWFNHRSYYTGLGGYSARRYPTPSRARTSTTIRGGFGRTGHFTAGG